MKRTSNRILSVAVSGALACSLFGAPAIATAAGDEAAPEAAPLSAEESAPIEEVTGDVQSDDGAATEDAGFEQSFSESGYDYDYEYEYEYEEVPATQADDIMLLDSDAEAPGTGALRVTLNYAFPHGDNGPSFLVYLEDKDTGNKSLTKTVALTKTDEGAYTGSTVFYPQDTLCQLIKGHHYVVTVSGSKFVTYEQEPFVYQDDGHSVINIYAAGGIDVDSFEPDETPGIMQGGNLTNSGEVDAADVRRLVERIENKTSDDADLNNDGRVDLKDFQLMAEFYRFQNAQADVHGKSIVQTKVNPADEETEVIYNEETGEATVGTVDEESISPQHSVSVTSEVDVLAEGYEIDTPQADEGNVIEGRALFEGEDQDGNPVNMEVAFSSIRDAEDDLVTSNPTEDAVEAQRDLQSMLQTPRTLGNAVQLNGMTLASRMLGDPTDAIGSSVSVGNGHIIIDFGRVIAVKRVTLTFTKSQVRDEDTGLIDLNLVEISSVQFLNGMEDRVIEDTSAVMGPVSAVPANRAFTLTWQRLTNVTGYEVSVTDPEGQSQTYTVGNSGSGTVSKTINSFAPGKKGKLENNVEYTVMVRPANGTWRGAYGDAVTVIPVVDKPPKDAPKASVTGAFCSIKVSWRSIENADGYKLWYRQVGASSYTEVGGIEGLSYNITGLPDTDLEYELYLKAYNEKGDGPASEVYKVQTTNPSAVKLPQYMLINERQDNSFTKNIASATFRSTGTIVEDPNGVNSSEQGNAMCLFDNDFRSYVQVKDWDLGTSYNRNNHGVNVKFTSPQRLGMITFGSASGDISYSAVKVYYRTGGGSWKTAPASIMNRTANGTQYTLVKLDTGIDCDEILLGVNRYPRLINMAEMRFHAYNDIEDRIATMYDREGELADLRIKLADSTATQAHGVSDTFYKVPAEGQRSFEDLLGEFTAELTDPEFKSNGEEYPFKSSAQNELTYIAKLLADEQAGMKDVVRIHTDLADAYDNGKNLGISGLNSWQPLGVSVSGGEQVSVYASAPKAISGSTKIDLYVGQYQGYCDEAPRRIGTFPIGRSVTMTIPTNIFTSSNAKEQGGQLYAVYTGNNMNDKYYVRVLGGDKIAKLDVLNLEGADRAAAVRQYVADLEVQMGTLDTMHSRTVEYEANGSQNRAGQLHKPAVNSGGSELGLAGHCVADATDVMSDKIMFSVPATIVWKAVSKAGSTTDERAQKLLTGLEGLDQMMELFYQHKGMMDNAASKTDEAPNRHLNVRYMEMFPGAFMYAGGNHIGIPYSSGASFVSLRPFDAAGNGGAYEGWGTAHEIGHNINDGRYAYAEVTNNYFAQMAKTLNGQGTRFSYNKVYDQVTSGAAAHSGNVFTQLAMYWQLMLAFDNERIGKLYDDDADLKANRFFARVDSYARNPGSFQGTVGLTLSSEKQNIIRLACAAARADLTDFFEAWGFEADKTTQQFAGQFNKDERALQYMCDSLAKVKGTQPGIGSGVPAPDVLTAKAAASGSYVTVTVEPKGYTDATHGYEITRVRYESGNEVREIVKFLPANGPLSFEDDASSYGNRVVKYEVCAVDKQLNRTKSVSTDQVKLKGDGLYPTTGWEVLTNMSNVGTAADKPIGTTAVTEGTTISCSGFDEENNTDEDGNLLTQPDPDNEVAVKAVNGILTGDGYSGKAAGGDPYVVLDMQAVQPVEHIDFTAVGAGNPVEALADVVGLGNDAGSLVVQVSADNETWYTPTSTDAVTVSGSGTTSIFFDNGYEGSTVSKGYINTEDVRYIKLTAKGMGANQWDIRQVQVFGPSGDDVAWTEAMTDDTSTPVMGVLEEDFVYQEEKTEGEKVIQTREAIPAGSIVFVGGFKGNPAYNNVVLFSKTGDGTMIVGGTETDTSTVPGTGEVKLKAQFIVLAPRLDNDKAMLGETSQGRWVYWLEPPAGTTGDALVAWAKANGFEDGMSIRAELYRVDDAFTNAGQRMTSDTFAVTINSVADMLANKITLKNTQDTETETTPETPADTE